MEQQLTPLVHYSRQMAARSRQSAMTAPILQLRERTMTRVQRSGSDSSRFLVTFNKDRVAVIDSNVRTNQKYQFSFRGTFGHEMKSFCQLSNCECLMTLTPLTIRHKEVYLSALCIFEEPEGCLEF